MVSRHDGKARRWYFEFGANPLDEEPGCIVLFLNRRISHIARNYNRIELVTMQLPFKIIGEITVPALNILLGSKVKVRKM